MAVLIFKVPKPTAPHSRARGIDTRRSQRLLAVYPHFEDRRAVYRPGAVVWFFPIGVETAAYVGSE